MGRSAFLLTLGSWIFLTSSVLTAPLPARPTPVMPQTEPETELAAEGISLSDLNRFPDHETVVAVLVWQEAHAAWLKTQIQLDLVNVAFWREWFEDADARRVQWRWLLRAHERRRDQLRCLCCLKNLEERIGREAYLYGRMPPSVPALRRFALLP